MKVSENILLDDGEYYVERNSHRSPGDANGFLLRRCAISLTSPGGYECIGSYDRMPGGKWKARIDAPEEHDSDCIEMGKFDSQMQAIEALWQRRTEAFCRHKPQKA